MQLMVDETYRIDRYDFIGSGTSAAKGDIVVEASDATRPTRRHVLQMCRLNGAGFLIRNLYARKVYGEVVPRLLFSAFLFAVRAVYRRRKPALTAALAALLAILAPPTAAQFRVELSGVGGTQVPVATARFRDDERTAQCVSAIVCADLEHSGPICNVDATNTAGRTVGA